MLRFFKKTWFDTIPEDFSTRTYCWTWLSRDNYRHPKQYVLLRSSIPRYCTEDYLQRYYASYIGNVLTRDAPQNTIVAGHPKHSQYTLKPSVMLVEEIRVAWCQGTVIIVKNTLPSVYVTILLQEPFFLYEHEIAITCKQYKLLTSEKCCFILAYMMDCMTTVLHMIIFKSRSYLQLFLHIFEMCSYQNMGLYQS